MIQFFYRRIKHDTLVIPIYGITRVYDVYLHFRSLLWQKTSSISS
nr:MAG TPA: hypothetical protein [Caudoviricetes sp.]